MNRALIWKEVREQGLIVAALVILGAGVLVAAGLLFPAPSSGGGFNDMRLTLEPRKLAIVLLLLASGVVVGGTLFAGEREQGTFPYLELLPVPRWRVWLGKALAGLILVLVAAGLLFAVAAGVGILGPPALLPFWALIAFTLAVAAYSWGALGSAFAKTSLAACGLGLLMAVGLAIPIYTLCSIGAAMFERAGDIAGSGSSNHPEYAPYGTLFGLVVIPLAISAWIYTSPDRNRFARDVRTARGGPVDPVRRRRLSKFRFLPKLGIKASLWVVARQNLTLTIVLLSVTVVSGLSLLQPTLPVLFVWPISTLLLGTVVGVTGWSDEQNAGSFRFWAERRMPVGRLWLAKVAYGLALVALLVVLLAVPSLIAAYAAKTSHLVPDAFRSRVLMDRDFPTAEFLWLWPVYGFAFGHLAGMLFRKAAVGTAVGIMTGGAIVSLWLPSLFAGGIHWYQLWIPPLLALATARALVWSWALDQLGGRRALLRLGAGSAAIALAMVGGIGYRVLEVPDDANTDADLAYRATIPPFDTNKAGQEIRRGAVLFADVRRKKFEEVPDEPLWPEGPSLRRREQSTNARMANYADQIDDVLALGWPADRPDADEWLDEFMANGWAESLVAASRMPLGTVEDPTELILGSPLRHLDNLRGCETILLVRGLQLQAKGKPEAFVEAVAATLSLTRNLRNKSFGVCGFVSVRVEGRVHQAIPRWLEKLGDRPDLLKEMLNLVQFHDANCPKLLADGNLPEQTLMRNSVNSPNQFVKQTLLQEYPQRNRETAESTEALDNEAELVAFAWAVPWEEERLRRLVGLGNVRDYSRGDLKFFHGLPGLSFPPNYVGSQQKTLDRIPEIERRASTERRASPLLLALRLYQLEKGKLPATLDALVPQYLPAVPLDPYDDRPFRYRVSTGETIQMELLPTVAPAMAESVGALIGAAGFHVRSNPFEFLLDGGPPAAFAPGGIGPENPPAFRMLELPAGRGILWSVGPDRIDDGGKWLAVPTGANPVPQGDLIFPVPPPSETKR